MKNYFRRRWCEGKCEVWEARIKRYTFLAVIIFLSSSFRMALAYDYTTDLSISLSEEYNDNIFLDHTDKVDDFITYISPAINLSVRSTTSELKIGYEPTFSLYTSNNDLNDTAHRFSMNGNFTPSNRLKFTIMDTFIKSSETSDIRTIETIGPITQRRTLSYNALTGNISYQLRKNLSYILGALYTNTDYKESGFTEVTTYSGNMGLHHTWSERTSFLVKAQYTKYDYSPESDAKQQDYSLEVTHRVTPTLTSLIKGGLTIVEIEDTDESDTLFNGGMDFTKTFERGEAVLSIRQDTVAGFEDGEPLRERSASLRLSRTLTEKWTASLSAAFRNYESVTTDNTDTDEVLFNVGLTYNFRPWANLILLYSYVDSDDKIDNFNDYYNNIVSLTLRLSYNKKL